MSTTAESLYEALMLIQNMPTLEHPKFVFRVYYEQQTGQCLQKTNTEEVSREDPFIEITAEQYDQLGDLFYYVVKDGKIEQKTFDKNTVRLLQLTDDKQGFAALKGCNLFPATCEENTEYWT